MPTRVFLLKLLPERFLDDFLNGDLFLNTTEYFGAIDRTDSVRFDPHDGIDETIIADKLEVLNDQGVWLPIPLASAISVRNHDSRHRNVLCLFAASDGPEDKFDERNSQFGERAVVLRDIPEFIRRVKDAALARTLTVNQGLIQYVDRSTYSGRMGPFRKFSEHKYQNEFRFVFSGGPGEPCRLPIGSIRDITYSVQTAEIPALWHYMRNRTDA